MKIADLFILLSVKGSDSSQKALGRVRGTLVDVKNGSKEVALGLTGIVYGLQKVMSASARTGTGLHQFSTITGKSAETLQRWQHAGNKVNVANEEITSSFRNVQNAMRDIAMGQGAPETLGLMARALGQNGIAFERSKLSNTWYVLKKIQESAKLLKPEFFAKVASDFGLTDGMIAAMNRQAFNKKSLREARIFSQREVKSLEKVSSSWKVLYRNWDIGIGKITAKHGLPIVKEIAKAATELSKLIGLLVKLSERIHLFEKFGKVISFISKGVKSVNDFLKPSKAKKPKIVKGKGFIDSTLEAAKYKWDKLFGSDPSSKANMKKVVSPKTKASRNPSSISVTVHNKLEFKSDTKNAADIANKVGETTKQAISSKEVQQTYDQLVKGQVN